MESQLPVIDLVADQPTNGEIVIEPDPAPVSTGPPAAESEETVFTEQIRYYTAICSFAAGALHLLAMAAHANAHPLVGRAFLATAILQIIWGVLLIVEPRRIVVILGGLMTVGFMAAWVLTRTEGISFFPGLEAAEGLEWRDVTTQFFQLLAVAGAALLLVPNRWFQPAAGKKVLLGPIAVFAVLTIGAVGLLYGATHNSAHGGGAESGHTH